ncbi:MFS transporter [Salmonella enterica]|uniref:MFS transporter n=1 Tax=Salmonella newport TaxID=108619 RepID=A0A5U9KSR1_SALNE|nr:MFS transporter [Salmonella enterica subsp. enterica serovar Newport]ECQ8978666.1 MFS transporter [Salmonella enterica subsp. enterica]EHJ5405795.1 MFS transporter [Salmonella enterica subsp. enterica serovar Wedding]EHQ4622280.1 MFS transporter [Salmonella enterica]EBS2694247.1 MFS transporter [Salmonella enterica subsp. enterica serovar Newport]
MTKRRYLIVFMMFLVIAINYMDRVNFAVSIPYIRKDFGFTLSEIGDITFVWGMVYALFNFPGGWIADRLGLRWGVFVAFGWWSIFTIASPFAGTLTGWFIIRGLMGAGEAPIWPFNAKAANSWASPSERSTAYTFAGSGQYLGPAVGSILVGWIIVTLGWEWSFIIFGAAGLLLLPVWIWLVRDTPVSDRRVSREELLLIGNQVRSDEEKIDWAGIKNVFFSRTGFGMLLIYLTFGYILFTFLNWVPSYLFYTFHMDILKSAVWSSLGAFLGFIGFLLSGPFNDRLVRRYDRLTARRIGTAVPMFIAALCVVGSLLTAKSGFGEVTAVLIGLVQLFMNMTVGAWAVNIIDISPNQASTGFVYGIFNGVLNVMGACNSLILTSIASSYGFPVAFGSAIIFMVIFLLSILFVVDRISYESLINHAMQARITGGQAH